MIMFFVYTPEGGTPKQWEFEPNKLMSPEAEAIERHTGMTYERWTNAVSEGSVLALHGLLYVMLKRSEPTLRWENVQFCMDEVDFQLDDKETAEAIERLEQVPEQDRTPGQVRLLETLKAGQEEAPKEPEPSLALVPEFGPSGDVD